MPTDEERREVARKMRREADEWRKTFEKYPDITGDIDCGDVDAIMQDAMRFCGIDGKTTADAVFDRLADLIDPQERTCRISQAYGDEGEELDRCMDEIACTPEDTVACICQSCGHEFRYERMVRPRFCPHCGARNVTEVDDGD